MKKVVLMAFLALSACAPQLGGGDYQASDVGAVGVTLKGTIVHLKPIMIHAKDPSQAGAGAVIGGLAGGAGGSLIGQGKGRILGTALGALGGAAAGHFAEQKMTQQQGIEYQIQLDRGDLLTITQGLEPRLSVGQKVLLIQSSKGRSRVVADNT